MAHVVIVDGMGFVFRAYHAVRGNLSRSRDGLPTNALYGLAQMLVKVVDDLKPDCCVVALDSKGPNWRHDLYPQYKANRLAPDEALVRQLPYVEPMIKAFGLPVLRVGGMEADDIIATMAARNGVDDFTIVTSDKDLLQLAGGKVKLFDTLKDKWSGPEESVEKFGVPPELVADVQGLMGDSSDNIPGVRGVGPKTAAELVGRFGPLEEVYARLEEIEKAGVREKLREHREMAFLSRELARLKRDVDLPAVDMSFRPRLHEAAEYLMNELEFKTLAARLEKRKAALEKKLEGGGEVGSGTDVPWSDSLRSPSRAAKESPAGNNSMPAVLGPESFKKEGPGGWGGYECVQTMEGWKRWLADIRKAGVVAFDTETTSLDPYSAKLVGISLCIGAGKACYVPVAMDGAGEVRQDDLFAAEAACGPHGVGGLEILDDLKALLADASVKKIGHNLKYDWLVVARALGITPGDTGTALQGMVVNWEDTMLMSACLDGGRWNHGMDELSRRHLSHTMIAYVDVCGRGKAQVTFEKVALDAATAYAAEDADATWRFWEVFSAREEMQGKVEAPSVKYIYECVEKPVMPVVAAMEARGVRVDGLELQRLSKDFAARMAALEQEIWAAAGHEFNVQSTQQLAVVLFDELGVGSDKHKKARSTAAGVLEEIVEGLEREAEKQAKNEGVGGRAMVGLAALSSPPANKESLRLDQSRPAALRARELLRGIVDYRTLAKLRSTYAEALLKQVNAETGRVHTNYHQIGAATGRFASTDPNLQNIPIRTEEGRKIRHAFVPREGWVMASADYSQIELRLLAHMSGSEALRKAFRDGVDIHAYTASLIRGIPLGEVSKEQRRASKAVNFGLIYGMGARSLAHQMGASVSEAQEWIDAYFARYDGVRDYMEHNKQFARENGYVQTLLGRRVWLGEIASTHGGHRAGAERAAINAPLQGSNADIIKLAMVEVEKQVGKDAQLLMQVHDELVLECAPEAVEGLKALLPKVMGGVVELAVPLLVEVGTGPNWEEAH